MGSIKDRNGIDITEAGDIKKRWQEYTEELYKKDLDDPDNHNSVVTHLEPDILECEVKWALGSATSNKARAKSRRWWRTGKPGRLLSRGSQRDGEDLATEQQEGDQMSPRSICSCDNDREDG